MTTRAFSYGGGVQSTAALVLAAEGAIDFPLFLFANVGDDSENPATITFVRDYAAPFAAAHGVELVEVQKRRRDGTPDTLLSLIERAERSIPIPARMENGAPGNRTCTVDYKVRVIARELKARGATEAEPATLGMGISVDEWHRMRSDSGIAWERLSYPLIERGMDRQDCLNVIERAGLPQPPKSSCFFCPFHRLGEWRRLRKEEPDLFWRSVELERLLNDRREKLGRDHVWLTISGRPLDEAITDDGQLSLWGDGASCDVAGYCHV